MTTKNGVNYTSHGKYRLLERNIPEPLIEQALKAAAFFLSRCGKATKVYHKATNVSVIACIKDGAPVVISAYWGR